MLCCCDDPVAPTAATEATMSNPERPATTAPPLRLQRTRRLLQCAASVATFALVPKCPACLAAYCIGFTGIGLSYPFAAAVRWSLIAMCSALLLYTVPRAFALPLSRNL
jgi:hypothetical protein